MSLCRRMARACAVAVVVDAAVPRPGLSSFQRPRRDLDPFWFAALSPIAYEACLEACIAGAAAARGLGGRGWCGAWLRCVEEMMAYGNAGLGSTLLLTLQAAGLGYDASRGLGGSREGVAGAARLLLEECGPGSARVFVEALRAAAPSYLGRLSWAGLPDASQPWGMAGEGLGLLDLLDAASLYDPVSRDASRFFELSFGVALPVLEEEAPCLRRGVERATYLVAGLAGDLLARRKAGVEPRGEWLRAAEGRGRAPRVGPGSAADIVVNAVARLVYEGAAVGLLC